jgi:hypothetical protein
MQTFSLNALAESFEVDRSTMVRAMRGVAPDLVKKGNRPTWKTATAARALEAHRRKQGGNGSGGHVNFELQRMFIELEETDAEMRAIETLEGRRAFARETFLPLVREVDAAMRADGRVQGEPEMVTDLRCDAHLRLLVVAGLSPEATRGCDWTAAEAWDAYNAGYEDDE